MKSKAQVKKRDGSMSRRNGDNDDVEVEPPNIVKRGGFANHMKIFELPHLEDPFHDDLDYAGDVQEQSEFYNSQYRTVNETYKSVGSLQK